MTWESLSWSEDEELGSASGTGQGDRTKDSGSARMPEKQLCVLRVASPLHSALIRESRAT